MIEVKNDWNWILKQTRKEIRKNEQLRNDYFKVARKYQIKPIYIIEMYHDGIRYGANAGKYLSFEDWFYRFYCNIENINESINNDQRWYSFFCCLPKNCYFKHDYEIHNSQSKISLAIFFCCKKIKKSKKNAWHYT